MVLGKGLFRLQTEVTSVLLLEIGLNKDFKFLDEKISEKKIADRLTQMFFGMLR